MTKNKFESMFQNLCKKAGQGVICKYNFVFEYNYISKDKEVYGRKTKIERKTISRFIKLKIRMSK